jgi:hypothetical protein
MMTFVRGEGEIANNCVLDCFALQLQLLRATDAVKGLRIARRKGKQSVQAVGRDAQAAWMKG